jgi:hypothetical protein
MNRSILSIMEAVNSACRITKSEIVDVFGTSKERNLYDTRVLICGKLIELGYSIRFISEFLNKHRATVHYYVKNYESIKAIYNLSIF